MKRKKTVGGTERTCTALLQPASEGGYTVTCPALPGLLTCGTSLEEARAMAEDAIRGYLVRRRAAGPRSGAVDCAIAQTRYP